MIECNECGAKISPRARKCPACGEPLPVNTDTTARVLIRIPAIVVLVVFGGAALLDPESPQFAGHLLWSLIATAAIIATLIKR